MSVNSLRKTQFDEKIYLIATFTHVWYRLYIQVLILLKSEKFMDNRKNLSRLTSDIPKQYHVKIKSIALLTGKTIREVLMDAINAISLKCITSDHIPNKETQTVLEEIKKGKI